MIRLFGVSVWIHFVFILVLGFLLIFHLIHEGFEGFQVPASASEAGSGSESSPDSGSGSESYWSGSDDFSEHESDLEPETESEFRWSATP